MSKIFTPSYNEPLGGMFCDFRGFGYRLFASVTALPADGATGFAEGALLWVQGGAAGGQLYMNAGTPTSSSWKVMTGTGVDLSGLTATAAEINRAAKNSTRPVSGGASLTVTQALHDGKTILLDAATGCAVALPAATGSGARYRFVVTVAKSGGSDVLTALGAHLYGTILMNTDTTAGTLFTAVAAASASGSTTITFDGSTKGGRIGDWVEIEDVATSKFMVRGVLNGSGTEATPYA